WTRRRPCRRSIRTGSSIACRTRSLRRRSPVEGKSYAPSLRRRVDLIEHAAVGEVSLLRLRPAAEVGNRDQLDLRKLPGVLRRDLLVDRAVEVLRDDLL